MYLCGMKTEWHSKYWYLRIGDFLPERIETMCRTWKRCPEHIIEFLAENANIFTSREEAQRASDAVRSMLRSSPGLQERLEEIRKDVDIHGFGRG